MRVLRRLRYVRSSARRSLAARREREPLSGRVADDGKNGNIGRKLNHEQQMARLRVKFQRARRG